jgi:hypothetical protein
MLAADRLLEGMATGRDSKIAIENDLVTSEFDCDGPYWSPTAKYTELVDFFACTEAKYIHWRRYGDGYLELEVTNSREDIDEDWEPIMITWTYTWDLGEKEIKWELP